MIALDEKGALDHYKTFMITKECVVITYENYFKSGDMYGIQFDQYDTALNFVSNKNFKIKRSISENRIQGNFGDKGHLLLHNFDGDFTLLTNILGEEKIKAVSGKLPKNFKAKELISFDNMVYIPGYAGYVNTLLCINWQTGKITVIKNEFKNIKAAYYNGHAKLENTSELLLYYLAFPTKKSSDILAIRIHEGGKIDPEINLSASIDPLILSGNIIEANATEKVIFGPSSNETRFSPQSFYFSKGNELNIEKPLYFNFSDITNFNKAAKEVASVKIASKDQMQTISINTQGESSVTMKASQKLKDGYLLIGECYHVTTDLNLAFNGYQYTQAFAVKLNLEGKMVWSTSFPMVIKEKPYQFLPLNHSAVYTPPIPPSLLFCKEDDLNQIHLFFVNENKLITKHYSAEGKFITETENELASNLIKSKNEGLFNSELKHWYGNYYLTTGVIDAPKSIEIKDYEKGLYYMQKHKMN